MKRLLLLLRLLVVALLIVVGAMITLAEAQEEGPAQPQVQPPSWLIAKSPAESISIYRVEVRTGAPSYVIGIPGVVHFRVFARESEGEGEGGEVAKPAYVYLLNFDPRGQATLLLPNPDVPLMANFLSEGRVEFPIRGGDGTAYIQAVVTASPIIPPALQGSPEQVIESLLAEIQAQGLSSAEWGAAWTSYRVLTVVPFAAPAPCLLRVETWEGRYGRGKPIYSEPFAPVRVFIQPEAEEGQEVEISDALFNWKTIDPGRYTVRVDTSLAGYKSPSPKSIYCPPGRSVLVYFDRLELEGLPHFLWRNPIADPECISTVEFDATRSGPEALVFIWDFGDGMGTEIVEEPLIHHCYRAEGKYQVTLAVVYRTPKYCPATARESTLCRVTREVEIKSVQPEPEPVPACELDSVEFTIVESPPRVQIGPSTVECELPLTAPIEDLKLNFKALYRKFNFTEQRIREGWLDGDSGVRVELRLLDAVGQEQGSIRRQFCTLNTDPQSMVEGCPFTVPVPAEELAFSKSLLRPLELEGINGFIAKGKVQKLRVLITIWITVRHNDLELLPDLGEIIVKYYDVAVEAKPAP